MQGAAMSAAAASEAAFGGVSMTKSGPLQPQHGATGVRLAYTHDGTPVYKHTKPPMYQTPAAASSPRAGPVGRNGAAPAPAEQHKRKRGRPRKYAVTDMPLAIVPPSPPKAEAAAQSPAAPTLPPGFSSGLTACGGVASQPAPPQAPPASEGVLPHKKRGRPPGSGNKQQPPQQKKAAAPGSGGIGLKPNVITVQVGEDVVSKVMSFSHNGWAVCVLSANGAVSNVTLRQAGSSGSTVNYEVWSFLRKAGIFSILVFLEIVLQCDL
ncbi:hypothetical protein E2562_022394 [Oryza meyeriana var. granulata]|uniref:AT-hook motif nuclear-localized protein n=1 Tax=Oryza meyeriana var. granulata TaxID=110450 RepID=A0A6G1EYC6_9ORYZ|nr:hypothetical protein E2562_022394 [Oryza meyeriana var. granulata]